MRHGIRKLALIALSVFGITACGGGGGTLPSNDHAGNNSHPNVVDNWAMYAHDAHHTSASIANVGGPLVAEWRYDPQPITGDTFSTTYDTIATTSGVYLHWQQYGSAVFSGGPTYDAISTGGQRLWSWVAHKDYDEGHWLSVYGNNIVFQDDGQGFLNVSTGAAVKTPAKKWASGFDMWGESIPDPSGLYSANTFKADGSDLFIYSLDATGAARWTQNQQVSVKYAQDTNGALVLSNAAVFYAANYTNPTPFASGLYALDAASGHQIAHVSTTPTSEMSADSTNIYLFEKSTNLVARAQSDLHVVWSVSAIATSSAAPVLANGLVIAATNSGIQARSAATGTLAWSSSVSPSFGSPYSTAMAAALGSNTLVVTAYNGIFILKLSDGSVVWHGKITGVVGTAWSPVIVNDPARGATIYVTDSRGTVALVPG